MDIGRGWGWDIEVVRIGSIGGIGRIIIAMDELIRVRVRRRLIIGDRVGSWRFCMIASGLHRGWYKVKVVLG
jgi:hypothetical protein